MRVQTAKKNLAVIEREAQALTDALDPMTLDPARAGVYVDMGESFVQTRVPLAACCRPFSLARESLPRATSS